MKKILFIAHECSRTGAPIALLRLQSWLKDHGDVEFVTLVRREGTLLPDYQKLGKTYVYSPEHYPAPLPLRAVSKLAHVHWPEQVARNARGRRILTQIREEDVDLIFSNTMMNGSLLELLAPLQKPVISRIAELAFHIEHDSPPGLFTKTLHHTTHFIAVSNAVKQYLVQHQVAERRISVLGGWLGGISREPQIPNAAEKAALRRKVGLPVDAFVVCSGGSLNWRKGADLFVHLALKSSRIKSTAEMRFMWIGVDPDSLEFKQIQHDVAQAGLASRIVLVPKVQNPMDHLGASDMFVLTSREDPYPIMLLEAASRGLPILCFEGAGGARDFVEGNAGITVPYLDVDAMSGRVASLQADATGRAQLGRAAAEKVCRKHHIEVAGPKVLRLVDEVVSGRGGFECELGNPTHERNDHGSQ